MGLLDRADYLIESYSRGMKQRLHLARGLIADARVLLFDEPDAGLHPLMVRSLLQVIGDIFCERNGVKAIMTTHNASTVALAPEEALYTIRRTARSRLRRASSRDEALTGLTVGLPTLSVRVENRRQVFVESKEDERRIPK